MFDDLTAPPPDDLMVVAARVREDMRPERIDLGVGVYRDAEGRTPIMPVVAEAARRLLQTQETKAYLPPAGDAGFTGLLASHVLGPTLRQRLGEDLTLVQAVGGTGALRLAAELVGAIRPDAAIWIGTPTWPNHQPIFDAARMRAATYQAVDVARQSLLFDRTQHALAGAAPGDIVLLQGCCHNPSGIDFSHQQWSDIAETLGARGLVPLIDFAYQGLGTGPDEDATGVRLLLERLPEAIVAVSCSKSFSLYRERAGLLIVKTRSPSAAAAISGLLQSIVRVLYSNPPDHGAAIVRTVLEDAELAARWREDLDSKRRRITDVRLALARVAAEEQLDLGFVANQRGLFSTLSVTPEMVARLGAEFAIHMPKTGRINIAGLNEVSSGVLVEALAAVGYAREPALA